MLKIDTLRKNKGIFNPDIDTSFPKNGIWDLCRSSISMKGVNVKFDTAHIVSSDEEMRADLIASKKYSDAGRAGSVLKINGISNPFSVETGEILYLPSPSSIDAVFEKKKTDNSKLPQSNTDTNPNSAFRKSQESKKSKISPSRQSYLNSLKNRTPSSLPPTFLQEGENQVVTRSGLIFFGPDTTTQE